MWRGSTNRTIEIMNTLQANTLIADSPFIKWVHHESPAYNAHEMANLKYHSDWALLMPVVEKITRTQWVNPDNSEDTGIYHLVTFGMQNAATGGVMVRFWCHPVFEAPTLLEACFLAVVDFIKDYKKE